MNVRPVGKVVVGLKDVRKSYTMGDNVVNALAGVDLEISEGEYLAIMGPSGSGKSTLLNLLGCMDRPTAGSYMLAGRDVAAMSDNELSTVRSERIGFIFQSFNLIPSLTVLENIEVPLFYAGWPQRKARARSMELAERVGLGTRGGHRPTELSGGQQQRVAIARALSNNPSIVLADEPTGNLDSRTGDEIMAFLGELNAEGRTIIMVTHEDDIAANARRIVTVRDGLIQEDREVRS
ncbi:MAG TPA: ABC transporter ATP-binding protein [Planctomycetota bacterium]|jgi:putative ABC transport system ATP-binding protein|nr:ABC transporter ATP-binding protein [Planctomycetota bacterium]